MEPKISAILPVYNVSAYLARCLDSILAANYQNLEIICVNDGSTDRSLEILRDYAGKDDRFVVIDQPNGGVSAARSAGIDRATGEYLSFIDPDDLIHPRYFETLLLAAEKTNADYVIGTHRSVPEEELPLALPAIDPESAQITPVSIDAFFESHLCRSYVWGRLLRRSVLGSLRFDRSMRIGEDGIFNADLWLQRPDLRACVVNAELYCYVQREGSAMAQSKSADLFNVACKYEQRLTEDSRSDLICLIPAIRRALTVRYLLTHIYPDRRQNKPVRSLLRRCAKRLQRSSAVSRKQKLLNLAMIRVPGLYWLYRVRQPGMWKWERVERKKRKALRRERR